MVKVVIAIFEYMHGMGFHRMLLMPTAFFTLLFTIGIITPQVMFGALLWIIVALPIIGLLGMLIWMVNSWLRYVRSDFLYKHEDEVVILEVKIPRNIMKSPKAMEIIFQEIIIDLAPTSTFIERWWKGGVLPQYSFELVSIEGKLHFYIFCEQGLHEFVRQAIYAQYPDVEIYEVPDYTSGIEYDPNKVEIMGREYVLKKSDALPIKTYKAYELDRDPSKMEQKADPLSSVFEALADIGPGEQVWLQIVITPAHEDHVRDEAHKMIKEIQMSIKDIRMDDGTIYKGMGKATPEQETQIKALSDTLDKPLYEVGIRWLYLAKKEAWRGNKFGSSLKFMWRAFNSETLNSIVQRSVYDHGNFDYPWQDWGGIRSHMFSRRILDAYRRRSFFEYPHKRRHAIMTPEELATIYHFPSEETKTPGLMRIESKKSIAPPNLPV